MAVQPSTIKKNDKRSEINNLIELEDKEQQKKKKKSRNNIHQSRNKRIKNRKIKEGIKIMSWFFERINKIDNPTGRMFWTKMSKTQVIEISKEEETSLLTLQK